MEWGLGCSTLCPAELLLQGSVPPQSWAWLQAMGLIKQKTKTLTGGGSRGCPCFFGHLQYVVANGKRFGANLSAVTFSFAFLSVIYRKNKNASWSSSGRDDVRTKWDHEYKTDPAPCSVHVSYEQIPLWFPCLMVC